MSVIFSDCFLADCGESGRWHRSTYLEYIINISGHTICQVVTVAAKWGRWRQFPSMRREQDTTKTWCQSKYHSSYCKSYVCVLSYRNRYKAWKQLDKTGRTMSNNLPSSVNNQLAQYRTRSQDGAEVRTRGRLFATRLRDGAADHVSVLLSPECRHHGGGSLCLFVLCGLCSGALVDSGS